MAWTPHFPLVYVSFQSLCNGNPCPHTVPLGKNRSLMYFFVPLSCPFFLLFWKSASCGFDHECKTIVHVHSCKGIGRMSAMVIMNWILLSWQEDERGGQFLIIPMAGVCHCKGRYLHSSRAWSCEPHKGSSPFIFVLLNINWRVCT